jgi:hypothetical protein
MSAKEEEFLTEKSAEYQNLIEQDYWLLILESEQVFVMVYVVSIERGAGSFTIPPNTS